MGGSPGASMAGWTRVALWVGLADCPEEDTGHDRTRSNRLRAPPARRPGITAEERAAMPRQRGKGGLAPQLTREQGGRGSACWQRSPSCRNRIAFWPSGSMPSSPPARPPSRRNSGMGCPRMPRTARSSASSRPRRSSTRGTQRSASTSREPRRRRHVADRLRADGIDRRRRGKDRCAREESGELRAERRVLRSAHRSGWRCSTGRVASRPAYNSGETQLFRRSDFLVVAPD